MQSIGAKLRALNRRKRLSQKELARRSGVARTTINDIEMGRNNNPKWLTVIKLCRTLKCTPNDLTNIDWEVEK